MNLTREQLEKINVIIEKFGEYSEWFKDYTDEWIFSQDRIQEIVENNEIVKDIEIVFPGEHDPIFIAPIELINHYEDICSIKIIDSGHIRTSRKSYFIVGAEDDYLLRDMISVESIDFEGVQIRLVDESLIIGLAAAKLGEYDSDYWGTYSQYLAIELTYASIEHVLSKEREIEIINSYIFEVADSTGIALYPTVINNPVRYDEEYNDAHQVPSSLRTLEPFNEGMKIFISAVQIKDPELQFLNFYKVLEHFAPIALNLEASELMRKKLDAPRISFADGDYIKSIFELANSTRDRFNDEDLIKASFTICFDFVGLYKKLPQSIQKKIKKQVGEDVNYSSNVQTISTASNMAGKIIYKTRNKVVHAKSNFVSTDDEIQLNEFGALNDFMKEASSQAIRWYNRQPSHLQLKIIK